MRTLTIVYGDNDQDFEQKINDNENDGWAVRQIVILPAQQVGGQITLIRSNIIVVFERGDLV